MYWVYILVEEKHSNQIIRRITIPEIDKDNE